jgi:hypothetical protein
MARSSSLDMWVSSRSLFPLYASRGTSETASSFESASGRVLELIFSRSVKALDSSHNAELAFANSR